MNNGMIESVIENNNFFIVIENGNNIKFKLSLPMLKCSKGSEWYDDEHVGQFIDNLKNNTEGSFILTMPDDLKVVLDMLHIQFIFDNIVITLANTEQNRDYLIVIFEKFIDYLRDLTIRI